MKHKTQRGLAQLGWLAAGLLLLGREGLAAELAAWLWYILAPFVIGGMMAFLLSIPMDAVQKNLPKWMAQGRRPVSLVITLAGVGALVLLVGLLILPQLAQSGRRVAESLPGAWESLDCWLQNQQARWPWLGQFRLPQLPQLTQELARWVGGGTVHGLSGMVGSLADFGLGLVFACYILLHRETLHRQGAKLAAAWLPPSTAQRLMKLLRLVGESFRTFFGVQCLEAVILGCLLALAMVLCRLPCVALVSVTVALTAVIPIFGSFVGGGVGMLLILAQQPQKTLWFLAVFLAVQQLEGSLIYPKVVGKTVGLPPIWVLAAVTLGGRLFGVGGMLLMIPVFRVIYTLLGTSTCRKLAKDE